MPLALLEARHESPAVAAHVEPDDFGRVAQVFADQQRAIGEIMNTLSRDLQNAGACIGKDHTAEYFDQTYQPAATTVMGGLRVLFDAVGAIAQGLAKAGTDHDRADKISATNWRTTDYRTYQVKTETSQPPPHVPALSGYAPGWLPGVLEPVWPTKSDSLPAAAAAWQAAQGRMQDVQQALHAALNSLVGNNHGEDLDALEEYWSRFVNGDQAIFTALDNAMHALAQGVAEYGAMIDDFGDQLTQAIVQAAVEAGAEALVAALIDVATDGLGLLLSGAEGEAIAARAVERVGEVGASLLAALQVASTIQDVEVQGTTNLAEAVTKVPQPNLVTHEAWQVGDDVSAPGQFDQGGDKGETVIASYLKDRGHVVMPITEDHGKEDRNADALVDGRPVDFKKITGSGSRTLRTALKGSERGGGQADEIFVDARSSGLGPEQVKAQVQAYFSGQSQPGSAGIIQRVTVLANDGSRVTYPDDYGGL